MQTDSQAEESRYLITGGGTAGHVYPGLALAEGIREREPRARFLFVGARNGAEERILPVAGHALQTLAVKGIPPKAGPFAWLRTLWLLFRSLLQAIRIILRFKPHGIIGTGGYASAPVLLAAITLRSLRLWKGFLGLHEANIIPGRFNRWVSGWVDFTGTSFPETLRFLPKNRALWTGYPLRGNLEVSSGKNREGRNAERQQMRLPEEARVLLVFGGSSGARTINRAIFEALPKLLTRKDLYVLHATGRPQRAYDPAAEFREILPTLHLTPEAVTERYRQELYLDHIEDYYSVADLVVCRSGAGTVWEIASYGIPAVLIPKSNLPGDHQTKNAYFLGRQGQARLLFEKRPLPPEEAGTESVDPDELVDLVFSILYQPETYDRMRGCARKMTLPCGKERFYGVIRDLRDRSSRRPGRTRPAVPSEPGASDRIRFHTGIEWLGMEGLLAHLEKERKHKREPSQGEKAYLRYKADHLLCSPRWQDRNMGVKLVGLIGYRERLPTLLHAIMDRTPVPWHRKLLGGDFEQVGFIRRNALQALWRIQAYDPDVRQALLHALSDPYYEVRSWAARAVDRLCPSIGEDAELERLLRRNLKDRWFEVVVESLRAVGRITRDPAVLSDLVPLLDHKNWKVQQATVRCLMRLLQADVVHLPRDAEAWMQKIPMKGLDFFPRFPLKQTWDDFQRLLSEKMENPPPPNTNTRAQ